MFVSKHRFYAAADPGHKGAVALMTAAGSGLKAWDMPLTDDGEDIDYAGLRDIYRYLKRLPDVLLAIEWPTAWPGAFNNVIRDAENFGRQKGTLEAFAFLHGLESVRLSPVTWKGKLGLDGKTRVGANETNAAVLASLYPSAAPMIRGPRGGLKDGRLDAFLMAHYLRLKSGSMAANAVRGSVEHLAAVLSMGPGKRKLCRMPHKQ
jgi:hypothetical protein